MFSLGTLLLGNALNAQTSSICGTKPTAQSIQRLQENKKYAEANPIEERAITYVPIKFHLIATDAGTGTVKESAVFDMLCGINEFYAPLDIQFYIKDGFNYFSNSAAATDPQGTTGEAQLLAKKKSQIVNVYLNHSFTKDGLLGYYTEGPNFSKDFLVIKKSEVKKGSYTAEHELGHFFGIAHPFQGWEDNDYNPTDHGNPVSITASPGDPSIPVEFVDGSNCNIAGDFICDTPASYNFANEYWNKPNCLPLDNSVKDKHGDIVDPDELNVMDYFNACASYHFSTKQESLIKADLTNRKATFTAKRINCSYTPNQNVISDTIKWIEPNTDNNINTSDVISGYGDIKLDWDDIPGATGYFVEFDIANNFASTQNKYALVTQSEWKAKGLQKNKKYYWHVYPYNEYSTCLGFSNTFSFTTGSTLVSTNDIKEIDQWNINPNPVAQNGFVTLEVNSINSFNANIVISDLSGRVIKQVNDIQFNEGQQQIEVSTTGINSGLYLVQIKNENGISTKKLAIH